MWNFVLPVLCMILRVWLRDSWNQYDMLAHSAEADAAGVQISPGVVFQGVSSPVSIAHYALAIEGVAGIK